MAANPNGNRPTISRAAAKAYWLALPVEKRTYRAVAARFGVTPARITQIAREDGWQDTLARIDREVVKRAERDALRTQLELVAEQRKIAARLQDRTHQLFDDDTTLTLDQALRRLPAILRVDQLLSGEATDRVDRAEVTSVIVSLSQVAVIAGREGWPPERTLAALREATVGLVALTEGPAA